MTTWGFVLRDVRHVVTLTALVWLEKRGDRKIFFQYQQEARSGGNVSQNINVAADRDALIRILTPLLNLSC